MDQEKKKILVVDDEEDLVSALKTSLSYEGFEVFTARDGQEGLEVAFKEKPDLIFLDIIMPNVDGIGFLQRLRKDEWGKEAEVVVMTVLDDVEKMADVVQSGGNEYILKTDVSLKAIVKKAKEHFGQKE